MIYLPDSGFSPSKDKHNSNTAIVCDWIEASVLFEEESVSRPQLVDVLKDLDVYSNSDFAFEYTEILFSELEWRHKVMESAYPFNRQEAKFEATGTWKDSLEYSFCLLVSLLPLYKKWKDEVAPDYLEQGELFEALTAFRLRGILPEWRIENYGWTRDNATPLRNLMPNLADLLCERRGNLNYWAGKRANDAGLDVLCVRPFPDEREGFFTLLIQCASGANWKSKLRDPNITEWMKYIDFACRPCKAVSIPYALDRNTFRRSVLKSEGLLFDRLRLFSHGIVPINAELAEAIETWLQPAVDCCPIM